MDTNHAQVQFLLAGDLNCLPEDCQKRNENLTDNQILQWKFYVDEFLD
jgi:endonuclease/exonuclease/phosphatase family metal-dependent hydrolase